MKYLLCTYFSLSLNILFCQAVLPFYDGFEIGAFDESVWTATANVEGNNGIVDVAGGSAALVGQFGARLGKSVDEAEFTLNRLDLRLDLQGKQDVVLDFFILDYREENHPQDGIFFSEDGVNFVKAWDFVAEDWCNRYGHHPPLNINKLAEENGIALTSTFIIRFQQYDDDNFVTNSTGSNPNDGFALDEVRVYEEAVDYAELPFSDDFEIGILGDAWAWRSAAETALPLTGLVKPSASFGLSSNEGVNSSFAVFMGKHCDESSSLLTANALDLHLNLAGKEDVVLDFWIRDLRDDNNPGDGIWASSDGGENYVKLWQFVPEDWCSGFGHHPPLNLSKLAAAAGIMLTDKFVVRFQQIGVSNFTSNSTGSDPNDGFYIDQVRVYEEAVHYAELPFADDFESGQLNESWAWRAADDTVLPLTGLVKPTADFRLDSDAGLNSSFAVVMGKRCDESSDLQTANALDLHLNLAGKEDVVLDFWIRDLRDDNNPGDGIWASDDGGENYVKLWQFVPEDWCSGFGHHPPLNLSKLAAVAGITLTDQFVVRFQQVGISNLTSNSTGSNPNDGFLIDELKVYEAAVEYASIPYFADFENGVLPPEWVWRAADETVLPLVGLTKPTARYEVSTDMGVGGTFAPILGKRCDQIGNYTATALDFHLNVDTLQYDSLYLRFSLRDYTEEDHAQDGIYLSSNGGATFTKIYAFSFEEQPNNTFFTYDLNLDSLASAAGTFLSVRTVIRFQQYDDTDFNTNSTGGNPRDGIVIDDVSVEGRFTSGTKRFLKQAPLSLFPNPARDRLYLTIEEDDGTFDNLSFTVIGIEGRAHLHLKNWRPGQAIDIARLAPGMYHLLGRSPLNAPFSIPFIKLP